MNGNKIKWNQLLRDMSENIVVVKNYKQNLLWSAFNKTGLWHVSQEFRLNQ